MLAEASRPKAIQWLRQAYTAPYNECPVQYTCLQQEEDYDGDGDDGDGDGDDGDGDDGDGDGRYRRHSNITV